MDGRKLHHFVCFAVTMGLVACASGDTVVAEPEPTPKPAPAAEPDKVPDAISNVNIPQSETTMEPTPPVNSTVNSTTTELHPTSSVKSSGPTPSSASNPSVCATVKPESKSCPTAKTDEEVYKKALFLIIGGALLFTCVVLLVTVTALACKVSHLRGQLSGSRSAQINGAGYWAGGREGGDVAGAGVGVAETSVMLEEVTSVQNEETAAAAAVAAEPGGAQAAADEAGRAEEADRGPTAAAAAGPEPAPAADPDPVESPKTQTAPAPTSEPTADKA